MYTPAAIKQDAAAIKRLLKGMGFPVGRVAMMGFPGPDYVYTEYRIDVPAWFFNLPRSAFEELETFISRNVQRVVRINRTSRKTWFGRLVFGIGVCIYPPEQKGESCTLMNDRTGQEIKLGDKVYLLECWGDGAPDPEKCPDGYSIGIVIRIRSAETCDIVLIESTHYLDLQPNKDVYYGAHMSRIALVEARIKQEETPL